MEVDNELSIFPSVTNVSQISDKQTEAIYYFEGARQQFIKSFDIKSAISARYEGFEDFDFIFVPSKQDANTFQLYTLHKGKLVGNKIKLVNNENVLSVVSEVGYIDVNFDNNKVLGVHTHVTQTYHNAKKGGCTLNGIAGTYMDCGSEINRQLREAVGNVAAFTLEVGCSAWIVCRTSVVIACTAMAAGNCIEE